jgi:predicted dehydrogenase
MSRKIRYGMIGGGHGAFIGGVHRIAAAMDGQIELVCGAFSSDPQRSRESGASLFLPPDRCYDTFQDMLAIESTMPQDKRMDFVSIVTPNHMHYEPVALALKQGFNVLSDKPATLTLAEAKHLARIVKKSGKLYCLSHNYTGYPLVKEMRTMVSSGKLGKIRKVVVKYPQGWLVTDLEQTGQKQASWRVDPAQGGRGGCMTDIGTHAANLAEYVTGLRIQEVLADLTTFVPGRQVPDDANMLLRFDNGARGILHCSQISVGHENDLSINIHGELGSLEWHQVDPNTLLVSMVDQPTQIYRTGGGYLSKAAKDATRTPSGHPEGYLEAFANIYRSFATAIAALQEGSEGEVVSLDFPSITEGVQGMAIVEAALQSSEANAQWVSVPSLL